MGSSPFYEQNRTETTSYQPRGGCFSAILAPLTVIFMFAAVFQFFKGETTQPWEVEFTINEIPASAQAKPEIAETKSGIASFFAPSVLFWESDILRWAEQAGLDPNLVATVMQIESCGDPRALSHAGAMGLFQVMHFHFHGSEDTYKPDINALRGMGYLRESLDTHQNIRLALAGYNGGIGTAAKPESQWPQETVRYAYWGIGIYKDAESAKDSSDRLEEWYSAGGASLCRQAETRLGIDP
jgi:soluble lytic murein transglycosylase-like protein